MEFTHINKKEVDLNKMKYIIQADFNFIKVLD
jgi:hypothetical protein